MGTLGESALDMQSPMDASNSAFASGWGLSTNLGTLVMTNLPCYLKMSGNLTGTGTWLIGSASNPIAFNPDNTPSVVMEFTGERHNAQWLEQTTLRGME